MDMQTVVSATADKIATSGAEIDREVFVDGTMVGMIVVGDDGLTSVSLISGYYNRAQKPQISWFVKYFEDEAEAIELYGNLVGLKGFLAFGSEFRVSEGSGFRFYQRID